MKKLLAISACAAVISVSGQASATPLDPIALLKNFNVITVGDFTNSIHVHGRTFVGGNYISTQLSELNQDGLLENYNLGGVSGTFFVGGGVSGSGVKNFKGDTQIGGTVSGPDVIAFNGGNVNQNVGAAPGSPSIPVAEVSDALFGLSTYLRELGLTLGATGVLEGDSNNSSFAAGATADAIEVFNLSPSDFTNQNTNFSASTSVPTIVNVSGKVVNFAGKISNPAPNLIFNFYEATSLTIGQVFSAHVIAPNAAVSLGSSFYGAVAANSLTLTNGQIHPLDFPDLPYDQVTPAPIPAPAVMLLSGLGLLGGLRIRRKRAA